LEDYTPFLYVEKIGGTGGTDVQADGVQNSMHLNLPYGRPHNK